jgi:hypothetical protein
MITVDEGVEDLIGLIRPGLHLPCSLKVGWYQSLVGVNLSLHGIFGDLSVPPLNLQSILVAENHISNLRYTTAEYGVLRRVYRTLVSGLRSHPTTAGEWGVGGTFPTTVLACGDTAEATDTTNPYILRNPGP